VTLHFLHVGKTGGTAIKRALRKAGLADTPYGPIELHVHAFRMCDLPPDDHVFFCVRDPLTRFVSGFNSRQRKGQPRRYNEWTPGERRAFEVFPTPQQLAIALASADEQERKLAEGAMRHIRHLRLMRRQLGPPAQLHAHRHQIVYIGRQETLEQDWRQLKRLLGVRPNARLPRSRKYAHRGDPSVDTTLDAAAERALRAWYASDFLIVRYCDRVRAARGWDVSPEQPSLPAWLHRHRESARLGVYGSRRLK
jgi:Sulfotransferase family